MFKEEENGNFHERLLYELDDEYASEDDIDNYQRIVENAEVTQNRLQEILNDDEATDIINARVTVTKSEIFLAVMNFALVYNLPQSAIADLFKMLNLFFSTSILPESRNLIDKTFNFQNDIEYHTMCPNCETYVTQFNRGRDDSACCASCNRNFFLKILLTKIFLL